MLQKDIFSYGGVFADAEAVADPTTEIAARLDNRVHEDVAQMTRVTHRVLLKFTTTAAAATVDVAPHADGRSVWGSGSSFDPVTFQKTATGVYVATFDTEYEDALVGTSSDSVAETETVSFTFCGWNLEGATFGHVQVTPVNNALTIRVFDGANALSDLGGTAVIHVWAA